MDARHASLGRRTLEEIRQKRAAERLSKASSGPDLIKSPTDGTGIKKSESANRLSENDISGLVSQLKDTMQRNAELEEANTKLTSMLQKKEVENDMLQKRLNDLEQNTVPSLRKALRDVAMEKDAAVVAREDLSAQLRTLKKRIKEAEEEQYRAEEDAAALRAELNLLQQQAMHSPSEHQQLVEEQARISALVIQKQELEEKLESISKRASAFVQIQRIRLLILQQLSCGMNVFVCCCEAPFGVGSANRLLFDVFHATSREDKERLEKQLHDMAVAIERLENSRQKLLMEIDSQSSEIERLFEENSSLSSAYQESLGLVAQWENQVKDCLKQNEELRSMVDNMRTEQTSLSVLNDKASQALNISGRGDNTMESPYAAELYSLKSQLSKEQSRAEALSGEVLQLSARLQRATQAYNGLARLYKPLLRNIENGLMKMKQDGSATVR
ncbi:hypothetical protein Sango_0438500 [Sesamum angolense]|uniref:Uncharacterized protein n=1 Tax=Sesamum angolense TaxID=2727404 RepID=A0AAE2C4Q7_9LAMI|nr:hypothetical protein Sango_0438500 [Sesamum angolense]